MLWYRLHHYNSSSIKFSFVQLKHHTVVNTLVSDETPPDSIDDTTSFKAANDKRVFRLVESFKIKRASYLSVLCSRYSGILDFAPVCTSVFADLDRCRTGGWHEASAVRESFFIR